MNNVDVLTGALYEHTSSDPVRQAQLLENELAARQELVSRLASSDPIGRVNELTRALASAKASQTGKSSEANDFLKLEPVQEAVTNNFQPTDLLHALMAPYAQLRLVGYHHILYGGMRTAGTDTAARRVLAAHAAAPRYVAFVFDQTMFPHRTSESEAALATVRHALNAGAVLGPELRVRAVVARRHWRCLKAAQIRDGIVGDAFGEQITGGSVGTPKTPKQKIIPLRDPETIVVAPEDNV